MIEKFTVAIAVYKGSAKKFLENIAFQIGVSTVEVKDNGKERNLTVDEIKESILDAINDEYVFILPNANRLPTSIRFFLEDCLGFGLTICTIAPNNPSKDIFLEMIEVELELPEDKRIREIMKAEASKLNLKLSNSELAELQAYAGKNPMLARKVIRNKKLGLTKKQKPEHTQYLVIMPIIISILLAFGIVRFIGMGTGNKSLYIFGGVTLVTGMCLKQLGSVKGARKRI